MCAPLPSTLWSAADGTFGPPPLLEDLELELEKQPFTFGAKAPESYPDLMELLRSLRREGR